MSCFMMIRKLLVFILFSVLHFPLFSLTIQAPPPRDFKNAIDIDNLKDRFEKNIRKYKLKNGIRVILMKNGFAPTVAAYLKVSTGSAEESTDISGTAHFLEHLLFKGTSSLGTKNYKAEKKYLDQIFLDGERLDQVNRQLENPLLTSQERSALLERKAKLEKYLKIWQKGAARFVISEEDSRAYSLAGQVAYNAYTNVDVTNYQIMLPKNRLELWAYIESNRFRAPVFREFYQERKVIMEERYMRTDSDPGSLLYELYLKTAFGFSPYGKPVIGFKKNIPRMTYKNTKQFFNNFYTPSRMVISIVGDVNFDSTIAMIKKYFEKIPERETPEYPTMENEVQDGKRVAEMVADNTPLLITGFKRPPITHKDSVALDALSAILARGQTSRLVKRLVLDDKLVSQIRSYPSVPGGKLESTFAFIALPFEEKNYGKIQDIIMDEVMKLVREGPNKDEIEKVKNSYFVNLVALLSKNAGLADSLSYAELIHGDYRELYNKMERVQKLTPKDIQNAARKYFVPEKQTTVTIKKKKAP